jgi:hypothetical protein
MSSDAPAPPGELKPTPDHLSFSQITKLSMRYDSSCPRAWAYGKLIGLPYTPSKSMILGSALDQAVQVYFSRLLCGDSSQVAHVMGLESLERFFDTVAEWPADADKGAHLIMMSGAYTTFVEEYAMTAQVVAVQRPHEFFVRTADGERKVIGFSDWIEADGTIVDLKFSGSAHWDGFGVWREDWCARVHDQLTSYYMGRLSDERAGKPDGVAPVVPRGRVVCVVASLNRKSPVVKHRDFDLTTIDVAALADAAREADLTARADYHPMRPGPACGWCSYVDRCRSDNARLSTRTLELSA